MRIKIYPSPSKLNNDTINLVEQDKTFFPHHICELEIQFCLILVYEQYTTKWWVSTVKI